MSDFELLLSSYCPHIFILTGVGKQIRTLIPVPNYKWFCQEGSNSYGGVAILVHQKLQCSIEDKAENFILLRITLLNEKIYIGGVYSPPNCNPLLEIFDMHKDKKMYLFGDFNAKHSQWNCENSNVSGNKLNEWLNGNGFEVIHSIVETSKRSKSVIDFCIGRNKDNWHVERLEEGTSDYYPIMFFSPFTAGENGMFRKTNWRMFAFFLKVVYPYWNAFVYNVDYNFFFDIFSQFLYIAALCDRCSEYVNIKKFRPPWPPHLVELVRLVNKLKRKFRRTRFLGDYQNFKYFENVYIQEKIKYEQQKLGAPQGSVLAALLFRLHIHYLPSYFLQTVGHLFADDLTIIIKGGLELRLSTNIKYLEAQAKGILKALEEFSDNHILPVNVSKTKAMFVHSAVVVQKPIIKYKDINIEYVTFFKCLRVEIGTKL
ncbi:unnamed protein product, partial [Rotaria sp. Silwood1]